MGLNVQYIRLSKLLLVILCIPVVTALILVGCNPTLPTVTEDPDSTAESKWLPDASKISVYSRTSLEGGVIITIPPGDLRIVPLEIKHGERIRTFHITAISGGGFQSFFRDSKGDFVLESTLMPWPAAKYYLYIRNESATSEYCKVKLTIRFMTE